MQTDASLYTIPFHRPFLSTLAQELLLRYGHTPETLSRVWVLLPTLRACRALREVLLECSDGKALLLPRIQALGDLDEDFLALGTDTMTLPIAEPPTAMQRKIQLALTLHKQNTHFDGHYGDITSITMVAGDILRFLDEMEREKIPFHALNTILPEDFSEHWQRNLHTLKQVHAVIEERLKGQGAISRVQLRNQQLEALAVEWRKQSPDHPVIAAGSTGSTPATAELLSVIARCPDGFVVLHGLDVAMQQDAWEHLEETHPQMGMKQLLSYMQCTRDQVRIWPDSSPHDAASTPARDRLLSELHLPASFVHHWNHAEVIQPRDVEHIHLIECDSQSHEAQTIALLLREVLESPRATAALVTPDRMLARRVSAVMQRFGIMLDDSAGMPLASTVAGSFLKQGLSVISPDAGMVFLLSFLKHPVFSLHRSTVECRQLARHIERTLIRDHHIRNWQELLAYGQEADEESKRFLGDLDAVLSPFHAMYNEKDTPISSFITQLVKALEQCSSGNETPLWEVQGGEVLWNWLTELLGSVDEADTLQTDSITPWLEGLLSEATYRPTYGTHPRLHIVSPMESRLLHYDRVILAGLNEGQWPQTVAADPFLSRPMRKTLGLPSPEQRIGQSAHDWCGAFAAREICLVRAAKQSGVATIESRWISRLKTLCKAQHVPLDALTARARELKRWAIQLDAVQHRQPESRPEPSPPLDARPRALSVSSVQDLLKNPYKVYARKILRLYALEPIEEDLNGRLFGEMVHAVLDRFTTLFPEALPEDPLAELLRIGKARMETINSTPSTASFWWNRFEVIAAEFIEEERGRREHVRRVHPEVKGAWQFNAPAGGFTLTAIADRIEEYPGGGLTIVDYKTGGTAKKEDIISGRNAQMPLEYLIARHGQFGTLTQKEVHALEYWKMGNVRDGLEIRTVEGMLGKDMDLPTLIENTREGLYRLIATYDASDMPYAAKPFADAYAKKDPYQQLARTDEWNE